MIFQINRARISTTFYIIMSYNFWYRQTKTQKQNYKFMHTYISKDNFSINIDQIAEIFHKVIEILLTSDLDHTDMSVLVVLSHGDKDRIYSSDGQWVATDWILKQFNNANCPRLRGKPKFFIFQACRWVLTSLCKTGLKLHSVTDNKATGTDFQT
jgi:hypothetical protein